MALFDRTAMVTTQNQKVLLVTASIVMCLFTSGIIFGYSGLYKVLVHNAQAFGNLCEDQPLPCRKQHDRLTLMYTIAAATISGAAFFIGVILDHFGPRRTVMLGAVIFAAGLVSLATASVVSNLLYYFGFFALALGGPCIFNSIMNFGELFPEQSAAIVSAQNGAFDASAFMLFVIGLFVDRFGFSFQTVILFYILVPVAILIIGYMYFPDKPFGGGPGSARRGELSRIHDIRVRMDKEPRPDDGLESPFLKYHHTGSIPDAPQVYNTDFTTQVKSLVFWSMTIVVGFLMLRINFYIGTVYSQTYWTASQYLTEKADIAAEADYYVGLFNYILPIGGVVTVPIAGWVLVQYGNVTTFIIIFVLNFIFSVISTLTWLPNSYQVIGFIAFSIERPFIFGAMAAYIGRLFGFENFGKLYGTTRAVGAVFTTMQYPLTRLTTAYAFGDFYYVNLAFLLIGTALTLAFPFYLWQYVFFGFFFRPKVEVTTDVEASAEQKAVVSVPSQQAFGSVFFGKPLVPTPPAPSSAPATSETYIPPTRTSNIFSTLGASIEESEAEIAPAVESFFNVGQRAGNTYGGADPDILSGASSGTTEAAVEKKAQEAEASGSKKGGRFSGKFGSLKNWSFGSKKKETDSAAEKADESVAAASSAAADTADKSQAPAGGYGASS